MAKSKVTMAAERLVTCYRIGNPLGIYAKRLGRDQEEAAKEAYERLANGEKVYEKSPVYCRLAWQDAKVARGMRLAIEEFKANHPEHADEIEETIKKQREVRRNYVEFGLKDGKDVSDEFYLKVMEECGVPSNIAKSTLNTALRLSEYLEEARGSKPARILV